MSHKMKRSRLVAVVWTAVALFPIFFFVVPWILGLLITDDWGIFLAAVLASQLIYLIGVLVAALRATGRRLPN